MKCLFCCQGQTGEPGIIGIVGPAGPRVSVLSKYEVFNQFTILTNRWSTTIVYN